MEQTKIVLDEKEMPTKWYNIMADLPNKPAPPLHPGTKQPVGPQDLSAIFPMALIEQEVSAERWIPIPEEVLKVYALWRPTPLCRAHRLEAALGTPARIYYKYEGVSPAGSHKPNTAVPQAYYNKQAGIRRIATETGAGQWGAPWRSRAGSSAWTCSSTWSRFRTTRSRTAGAPWRRGGQGPRVAERGDKRGQEGPRGRPGEQRVARDAISEAVEDAATHADTNYALGSVLNHVLLHQTVIGLEAQKQFEKAGDYPDVIYGCCGGGSNLAGVSFPFVRDKISGRKVRVVAVEPTSCPTLTKGQMRYDFGDTVGLTPLLMMYTLGHDFVPPGIHAGGLRYHGDAP